jgi:hypothetical protein
MIDASGMMLGKAGALSGILGGMLPSRDRIQRSRWLFADQRGTVIAPTNWPGASALRGEMNFSGLIGRYQNDGEQVIKVTSIPILSSTSGVAAVTFLQRLDCAGRSADGSHADLEQRFMDTLVKSVASGSRV